MTLRRDSFDSTWDGTVLTVGALKAVIEHMDDEAHVVLATADWYVNVSCVIAPHVPEKSEYQCLTIFPGADFDARQF